MSDRVVLALGYFDGVHKGHAEVIKNAVEYAKKTDGIPVVVSFCGNLRATLGVKDAKYILSEEERKSAFYSLGAKEVFLLPTDKATLSMAGREFLDLLNSRYDVYGYVCGEDYRFGKNGRWGAEDLKKYAAENGQTVTVTPTYLFNGKKVSSTLIKTMLKDGKIECANSLLFAPYSVSGTVGHGRGEGRNLGYPTLNLKIDEAKAELKDGVYLGGCVLDGKYYPAMINYGDSPTFDSKKRVIETFALGFKGDAYGKKVTVVFKKYLRDIEKFGSEEELRKQLEKDEEKLRSLQNDEIRTER